MSAAYVPQVGDTVRHPAWPSEILTITAVGRHHLLAVNEQGTEIKYVIAGTWVKVVKPTPLPYALINVHPAFTSGSLWTRRDADRIAGQHPDHRIAVIHLWTDEEGVDHADIERVEQ